MSKTRKFQPVDFSSKKSACELFYVFRYEKQQVEINLHVYPYFRFEKKSQRKINKKLFKDETRNMLSYEGKAYCLENAN
jgi:hypothetical protein